MMKFVITMVFIIAVFLIHTDLQAKERSWKRVDRDELRSYRRGEYHLRPDVQCLEIRKYFVDKKNRLNRNYWENVITWCQKPYNAYDPERMKHFRKAKPNLSRNGDMGKREAGYISNAFVMDNENKMWRMNMVEDIVRYLGTVDTLAEARLILWLYGKQQPYRYRKTSKGYEFLIAYTKSAAGCQKCKTTEICIEDREVLERATVDKKGDIIRFEQLKSKVQKQECIER